MPFPNVIGHDVGHACAYESELDDEGVEVGRHIVDDLFKPDVFVLAAFLFNFM